MEYYQCQPSMNSVCETWPTLYTSVVGVDWQWYCGCWEKLNSSWDFEFQL